VQADRHRNRADAAGPADAGARADAAGEGAGGGADPVRPLRRDAERNRQRILTAAWEVFNERGLEVSLDDVARHAGVGVGTVYRRFRSKEELVEALFVSRIDAVAALAEAAAEMADPWSGLVSFMEQMIEMLAGDVGLRHLLMFATYGRDRVSYARQRNAPLVGRLVERAQAAGQVRSDLAPTDVPFIIFTLAEATQFGRAVSPQIWRRYFTLVLDGLRPQRAGATPLPVPALSPEEMENTMRQNAPRRR
jgi:AcrR family transcriptional regulator